MADNDHASRIEAQLRMDDRDEEQEDDDEVVEDLAALDGVHDVTQAGFAGHDAYTVLIDHAAGSMYIKDLVKEHELRIHNASVHPKGYLKMRLVSERGEN